MKSEGVGRWCEESEVDVAVFLEDIHGVNFGPLAQESHPTPRDMEWEEQGEVNGACARASVTVDGRVVSSCGISHLC